MTLSDPPALSQAFQGSKYFLFDDTQYCSFFSPNSCRERYQNLTKLLPAEYQHKTLCLSITGGQSPQKNAPHCVGQSMGIVDQMRPGVERRRICITKKRDSICEHISNIFLGK